MAGVWCGWSLATPAAGSSVLLPATPGWDSLSAVVGAPRHSWLWVPGVVPRHSRLGSAGGLAVWCAVLVCWWGCGWCVVWLVPRHSLRRFLCAPPRHSWLAFAAGGGGRSSPLLAEGPGRGSSPLLAGVRWRRWCVVAGVWRWFVGGVVAGVWCGWSLATPGGDSCVLLPATPGWVSLPVVVRGPRHSWLRVLGAVPRHSWLGSAGGGGVWCAAVVCWWGCEAVPRTPWLGYGIQPVSGPLTPSTEGKTGLRSTDPMYGRRPLTPGASPAGTCSVP